MAGPTVGEIYVRARLDQAGLVSGMAGMQKSVGTATRSLSSQLRSVGVGMSKLGIAAQSFGRSMTTYVTLPVVGVGIAATKMAMDFNKSFIQVKTLAGDTGMSINQMKESVLDLAGETAQAPLDLAQGLYFVASSGAKAADVMPILEAAAKGAASGMGDVQTIASLLTSATNAYADSNLSAAKAMDIFVATVREGKAEPAELASTLGTVIPVAAQMGVGLEDVGAALATATNLGVPLTRAVTGLRYLLASLQKPTDTANAVMKDYGITAQEVNDTLAEPQGLLKTMQMFSETLDLTTLKGRQAFQTIVGGARGAIVANTLVGGSAKQAAGNFDALAEAAAGAGKGLDEVFQRVSRTPEFKFAQAMAQLKAVMIDLGNTIIPILTEDVIPVIIRFAEWFDHLGDDTKKKIVLFAGGLAILGPALIGVGLALRTLGTATKGLGVLAGILRLTAVGGGAAGAAGGAAATGGLLAGAKALGVGLGALAGKLALVAGAVVIANKLYSEATVNLDELQTQTGLTADQVKDLTDQLRSGAAPLNIFSDRGDKVNEAAQIYNEVLADLIENGYSMAEAQALLNERWDYAVEGIGGITGSMPEFERRLRGGEHAVTSLGEAVKAAFEGPDEEQLLTALDKVYGSLTKSEAVAFRSAVAVGNLKVALDILAGAYERAQSGQARFIEALPGLIGGLIKLGGKFDASAAAAINAKVEEGKFDAAIRLTVEAIKDLPKRQRTEFLASLSPELRDVVRDLLELQRMKSIHIQIVEDIIEDRRRTEARGGRVKGGVVGDSQSIEVDVSAKGVESTQRSIDNLNARVQAAKTQVGILQGAINTLGGPVGVSISLSGYATVLSQVQTLIAKFGSLAGFRIPFGIGGGGIVTGQTGFIARGPTLLVGEGRYGTFAGKGAEAVIPLNERGITILSEAMSRAMERRGRSGGVTVNVAGKVERPEDIRRELVWLERSRGW